MPQLPFVDGWVDEIPNSLPKRKEQKQLFGQTVTEQTKRWALDRHAWFGIFTPDRIVQTENMCPAFVQGSTSIDYGTWLHTVIMI